MLKRGRKPKKKEKIEEETVEITEKAEEMAEKLVEEPEKPGEKQVEPEPEPEPEPEKMYHPDEAARYLGVNEMAVKLWIDHGHLELKKINGVLRIPFGSLERCRIRFRGKHNG